MSLQILILNCAMSRSGIKYAMVGMEKNFKFLFFFIFIDKTINHYYW